jgi:hypothetical protein
MGILLALILISIIYPPTLIVEQKQFLVVPYSLRELVIDSDLIIIGTIERVSPVQNDPAFVDVEIKIERFLKNPLEETEITFRNMRSKYKQGIYEVHVSPAVDFQKGERVLLFLEKSSPTHMYRGEFFVRGVFQGKVLLRDGMAYYNFGKEGRGSCPEEELVDRILDILRE